MHAKRSYPQAERLSTACSCSGSSDSPANDACAPKPPPTADINQIETQLRIAVAAEDYALAGALKAQLQAISGTERAPLSSCSWASLGLPEWLVDRTERLGFPFPTWVQQKAIQLILLGADVVISTQTGSGKTLAFLLPTLAMLEYPPAKCDPFSMPPYPWASLALLSVPRCLLAPSSAAGLPLKPAATPVPCPAAGSVFRKLKPTIVHFGR
jgi:hypothetical protein